MNNTVENDFLGFPKVKWLQYRGEVDNCTSYWCQMFSGFNTPKIIKIGKFFESVIWKIKRWTFCATQCNMIYLYDDIMFGVWQSTVLFTVQLVPDCITNVKHWMDVTLERKKTQQVSHLCTLNSITIPDNVSHFSFVYFCVWHNPQQSYCRIVLNGVRSLPTHSDPEKAEQ